MIIFSTGIYNEIIILGILLQKNYIMLHFPLQLLGETFENQYLLDIVQEWSDKERGSFPTPIECMIIAWVFSFLWKEVKEVYEVII